MISRHLFIISTLWLNASILSAGTCTGEGPEPFRDITEEVAPQVTQVGQRFHAQDFLFTEATNSLFFRGYDSQLRRYALNVGHLTGFMPMDRPIARVQDQANRYVVSEGDTWVLDTNTKEPHKFTGPQRPLRHLYWHNKQLYTLSGGQYKNRAQVYEVYRHTPGQTKAERVCQFAPQPIQGVPYQLVEGFHHPYVSFYLIRRTPFTHIPTVYYYELNVDTCQISTQKTYFRFNPGRIFKVYRFKGANSHGIAVERPRGNFFWDENNRCRAFSIPQLEPIVLDYEDVTLATWATTGGVKVWELRKGQMYQLLNDWKISNMSARDAQISTDHTRVFISPLKQGASFRQLAQIQLKPH